MNPETTNPDALDGRTLTERPVRPVTAADPGAPRQVSAEELAAVRPGGASIRPGDPGSQWARLQALFVDDPAGAVREASDLVEETVQRLLDRPGTPDTEELRSAFVRYRELHATLASASASGTGTGTQPATGTRRPPG